MARPLEGAGGRCPVCGAPADAATRPFCSSLCADVDLLRWLRGGYAVPVEHDDEDEDGDAPRSAGADSTATDGD